MEYTVLQQYIKVQAGLCGPPRISGEADGLTNCRTARLTLAVLCGQLVKGRDQGLTFTQTTGGWKRGFEKGHTSPPQNCSMINAQVGIPCLQYQGPIYMSSSNVECWAGWLAATQHTYLTHLSLPQKQKARPPPCIYRSTTEKYVGCPAPFQASLFSSCEPSGLLAYPSIPRVKAAAGFSCGFEELVVYIQVPGLHLASHQEPAT